MVMVKTMVKRGGPRKLNWKSFFHDYDDDDSGVGDDGDDDDWEGREARQIKLEGIYSKDFEDLGWRGEPLFNNREELKSYKRKMK